VIFWRLGSGGKKRSVCFCLSPSFWRRARSGSVIQDQEQAEEVAGDGDGQMDVKCEPVPPELASKNVIT